MKQQLKFRFNLKYAAVAAVVVVLLANGGFRKLVRNYREHRRLAGEKARLEAEHRDLQRQLTEVGAKPAIEQAARRELSMLRPGETEYRFEPPKESDK